MHGYLLPWPLLGVLLEVEDVVPAGRTRERHGGSGQHSGGRRTPACNRGVFPEAHEACQRRRQRDEQHVPRLAAAPRCAASLTGLRASDDMYCCWLLMRARSLPFSSP